MIQVYLQSVHCDEETDEVGSDEPFVIVVTSDLTTSIGGVPVPTTEAFLYGPFAGVDKGETHFSIGIEYACWGITGSPAPLDPNNVLFIVALLENDDGHPTAARGLVKSLASASLLASLNLPRPQQVANLIRDINSAVVIPTGGPSFDEPIGSAQQLVFSAGELARVNGGERIGKTLTFAGDGGRYRLVFIARLAWVPWFIIGDGNPLPGPTITALAPRQNHVDLFTSNGNGVWSKWWEPQANWQPWFQIPGSGFLPPAPVAAITPRQHHIDLFVCDREGVVWSTWWEPSTNWTRWFPIRPESRPRSAGVIPEVTTLIPRPNHIDLFLTDDSGRVWSTWWEPQANWQAWFFIGERTFKPGAAVTPLAARANHVDLFVTDRDGVVWTTWWEPSRNWQPWMAIHPEQRFSPGATVTALMPRRDHIDLFVTDGAGVVWSTWWEPGAVWQPWFPISPGRAFAGGATVTALLPRPDNIYLFVTAPDGTVWTTSWRGGPWQRWSQVAAGAASRPNGKIEGLIPRFGHMDLFVTDGRTTRSTYWEAN